MELKLTYNSTKSISFAKMCVFSVKLSTTLSKAAVANSQTHTHTHKKKPSKRFNLEFNGVKKGAADVAIERL